MTADPVFAGLARQAELIAAGELSSRELVEMCLRRIERLDPTLNAFRVVFAERALAEAGQADGRRGAGGSRPLLGVPIAIKDDTDVAGEITAHGTNAFGEPAREDAEVVRRLRAAGAVIVGKTNVPELEITPFTESPTFGATRNPWDLNRTPGGSSGGSAAAVAAGLVGGALGSDGGGSIRIPAGCCGLFGLKTQRGRIPMAPLGEPWHGLSVYGPIVRHVADAALFTDVTGDGEPLTPAVDRAPGSLRIAVATNVPPPILASPDAEQRGAVESTAELLRGLGHEVTAVEVPYGTTMPAFIYRYLHGIADAARALPHPERLARRTRGFVRLGRLIPAVALQRALAEAEKNARAIATVFERADVLHDADVHAAPDPDRHLRGPRRAVDDERHGTLGALHRGLQPHRPARRLRPRGLHRRPLPARRPARRPPRRRGDAALALRPDRSRATLGRPRARAVSELTDLAEAVAREAGAQLRTAFEGGELRTDTKSSPTDMVSEADVAAEDLIRERLLGARPDDGLLGEEGSDSRGTSGLRWIVDPLDGTTNFLFGIPQWGVSIAVEDEQGMLAGVVYDPMRDELWAADRGGEPMLDGAPLTPRAHARELATALVATGFGYEADVRRAQAEIAGRLLPLVRDIRRIGSAAIDLAWTAAGRYDAYFERGIKTWDYAAGALICEAAGLVVTHLDPAPPMDAGLLVAPRTLADELTSLVD